MLGDVWEDLGVPDPGLLGVLCFTYLGSGMVLAGTGGSGPAGGHCYKSLDYGNTWVDKGSTPGDQGYIRALVNCGSGVVVAAMGPTDSDVERSSDWGESFVFIKELDFFQKSCDSATYCGSNIVLIGTNGSQWTSNNGKVFKSTDEGLTWDAGQVISTTAFDVCTALLYLGSGIVIAGTNKGEIARSINYGANWTIKIYELVDSGDDVRDFVHLGGGVVLLSSDKGHIYRSSDYGANWSKIASPGVGLCDLAYAGSNMVFVSGAGGHVYRSLDGGYNWTDLGVIVPGVTDQVRSLCYFASDTEKVLVAGFCHLTGDGRIARTSESLVQPLTQIGLIG